jgi:hypothetical protein
MGFSISRMKSTAVSKETECGFSLFSRIELSSPIASKSVEEQRPPFEEPFVPHYIALHPKEGERFLRN